MFLILYEYMNILFNDGLRMRVSTLSRVITFIFDDYASRKKKKKEKKNMKL